MFSDLSKFESLIPVTPPTELGDLNTRLRIFGDDVLEVWYAPLGQSVENPKLWILGITPGWNQMRISYEGAAKALNQGLTPGEAAKIRKPQVAFAGSMRSNLISMMDQIGLAEAFGVDSTIELFGSERIRTGSVLKYPVFCRGKNYAGHSPLPTKHRVLVEMLDVVLAEELEKMWECLILPLGKTVEACLDYSAKKGRVDTTNVLAGFPHPSGANGHRHRQFSERQEGLSKMVSAWSRSAA